MRRLRWTSLALAGAVVAAVMTPAHAQQVEIKPTAKVKRDKYVITAEEIAGRVDLTNAYDAVKLLRPEYLRTTRARGGMGGTAATGDDRGEGGAYGSSSGGAAATTAVLYIDEVKQPALEDMKNIRTAEVFEIRYLTGNQAAGRYGAGHEGGALLLKTNRIAKP